MSQIRKQIVTNVKKALIKIGTGVLAGADGRRGTGREAGRPGLAGELDPAVGEQRSRDVAHPGVRGGRGDGGEGSHDRRACSTTKPTTRARSDARSGPGTAFDGAGAIRPGALHGLPVGDANPAGCRLLGGNWPSGNWPSGE